MAYHDDMDDYIHHDFEWRLPDFYFLDLFFVQQGTENKGCNTILSQQT